MAARISCNRPFLLDESDIEFGKPQLVFRPSQDALTGVAPGTSSISRDGERIIMAIPPPQLRQMTIFDRQAKGNDSADDPSIYIHRRICPDGELLHHLRHNPRYGNQHI